MAAGAACTQEGTGDGILQRWGQLLLLLQCCCCRLLQLEAVVLLLLLESCMVAWLVQSLEVLLPGEQ